jgi:hypothetical protein
VVAIEYPSRTRVGDEEIIRLVFGPEGADELALNGGISRRASIFDSHTVIAEAVVDLAGVEVRPPGALSGPLLPGKAVGFRWTVRPPESGTYRGTVWLFLVFADKETGRQSRRALLAISISMEVGELLGLDGGTARWAGGAGSVIGVVLAFPFLEDGLKYARRRTRAAA